MGTTHGVRYLRSVIVEFVEELVAGVDVGHAVGVQASEERVEQVLREAEPRERQRLAALVDACARAGHRLVEEFTRLFSGRVRDAALEPFEAALRLLVLLCLQA